MPAGAPACPSSPASRRRARARRSAAPPPARPPPPPRRTRRARAAGTGSPVRASRSSCALDAGGEAVGDSVEPEVLDERIVEEDLPDHLLLVDHPAYGTRDLVPRPRLPGRAPRAGKRRGHVQRELAHRRRAVAQPALPRDARGPVSAPRGARAAPDR